MTDRVQYHFPLLLLIRMVMDLEAIGKPRAVGVVAADWGPLGL